MMDVLPSLRGRYVELLSNLYGGRLKLFFRRIVNDNGKHENMVTQNAVFCTRVTLDGPMGVSPCVRPYALKPLKRNSGQPLALV